MLYPFAVQERMSGRWLVQMLKKLSRENVIIEKYGHYMVLGFDYIDP